MSWIPVVSCFPVNHVKSSPTFFPLFLLPTGWPSALINVLLQAQLGPVYLSVTFRNFGGETRQWRLNQHPVPINVAKLFAYSSTVLFWLLDGRNRAWLGGSSWYPRLSTPPQCPSHFMLELTRIAINVLYFLCTPSD